MRAAALLLLLLLLCGLAHAAPAWWLSTAGLDYDEECMTYCLQGLANRDAPRLLLDTSSVFWTWPPSDQYWLGYLHQYKGFDFTRLENLREAVAHFRADVKGLALYDPAQDGTRYVALTLAAQRSLLPVTPAILRYETPGMREGGAWTDDPMTDAPLWREAGARAERAPGGIKIQETATAVSYGAVDRVVELDLARTPLVEVTVESATGTWALKINEGTPVDTLIQPEGRGTGTVRCDLRGKLTRGGRVTVRLFTVGAGSSVVVSRLRFLGADGQPVAAGGDRLVDCFAGLPVVEDLRGRFPDDAAAYRWALDNLMPACTKKLVFSAGHTHGDTMLGGDPGITLGMDYPVAQKAFIFNLSPMAGPFDLGGRRSAGYPAQAALFDEIMRSLDRPAGVYGWAEPESGYCDRVSRDGNFVVCAAAPNLSFWAKVPVAPSAPGRPGPAHLPVRPSTKALADKFYLTFETNEGDTPKILAALQGGAWLSPDRGQVPVAWGVDPYLAGPFPALIEYFVSTATPNDSFFAGCSGGGYCYPWVMPRPEDYFRHVGRLLAAYGPNVVDVWESGLRKDLYERFRDLAHADCFTQQTTGAPVNEWLDDGTPILGAAASLYYFELKAADPAGDLVARIQAVARAHRPPYFILAYGGVGPSLCGLIKEAQRRLPADQFEVVGAQDMAALARQAGMLSLALDSLGVAPGGKLALTVTLRNPGGAATPGGMVEWTLLPGWRAAEERWEHGPVPPGTALRHTVTLTAGPQAGREALLTCADSATGQVRRLTVPVYAETRLLSDFSAAAGWRETGATLSVAGGVGKVTTPGQFASVRMTVEADFDRGPRLELSVPRVEGLWALKVNDGTLPVDILLQPDGQNTGRFSYDLAQLTGWKGRKGFEVILFAISPGTSVYVDEMKLHYAH